MSSPPDLLAGADLISGFNTPSTDSPLSSSPPSPPSPASPPSPDGSLYRSRTAPPLAPFSGDGESDFSPKSVDSSTVPVPHPHPQTPTTTFTLGGVLTSSPTAPSATTANGQPSSSETSPASCLRRTSSSLSSSSSGNGNGHAREKKRLRFTPVHHSNAEAGPSSASHQHQHQYEQKNKYKWAEEGAVGQGQGQRYKRIPRDQVDYLRSEPGTPNLSETADQIRRTLSLASLESLLLLSNNPSGERDKLIAEVSKAGRGLVWRDKDEPRALPGDNERALILAVKRGLRSFILAFSVRAGVNVILALFRNLRNRKLRFQMILHAIFGAESFRFGGMIGTFTLLYTTTLHALRLAPPLSYFRRRVKNGVFNKPTFGPPQREGDEGERRWQAAVAGAVGSLALLCESKSRRSGVAQQMFVRGLQASYNHYTPRYGIHIPHGAVLLFGACCGQIMFAWLCSPETIPKEYSRWIQSASGVPEFGVAANRSVTRYGILELADVQRALQHKHITPYNKGVLENLLEQIRNGWKPSGAVPCELVHPWIDSCYETNFRRFFTVFRFMLPVYSALHLIPMLVLRRSHVKRDPLRMLARALWGITRSCSFLGGFVLICQTIFCLRTQAIEQRWGVDGFRNLLKRKETFWLLGFSTCLSLFVEERKRRAELAMYVLPRALESAWSAARSKAWVPLVPFGETILGAAAMAMVMDSYKHKPDAMSGIVRRLLFQLVGPA